PSGGPAPAVTIVATSPGSRLSSTFRAAALAASKRVWPASSNPMLAEQSSTIAAATRPCGAAPAHSSRSTGRASATASSPTVAPLAAEVVEVGLADHRRLQQPRPFALQSAEAGPPAEGELDLLGVDHLEQDGFVAVVRQPRQALAQARQGGKEVGDGNDERAA